MKRLIKILGILILLLIIGIAAFVGLSNEDLPTAKEGPEADALALKMMDALGKEEWDKQSWVAWSFKEIHSYEWNKHTSQVRVMWDSYTVDFSTLDGAGKATGEEQLKGAEAEELIAKAKAYFDNDSFWLYAPFKSFDEGTTRGLVALDDGTQGLLVTHHEGGTTPGDSYLWHIGDDGVPVSVDMWVDIIPIGGISATWEEWNTLSEGARIATTHKLGPMNVEILNLRSN